MELETLYNLDYASLKGILFSYPQNVEEILKDIGIKEILINPDNQYEFIWFVQDDKFGLLEYILDSDGISILQNSSKLDSKLDGILSSMNPALPKILKNPLFCNLLTTNISTVRDSIFSLTPESALVLMDQVSNKEVFNTLALSLSDEAALELVKNRNLSHELKIKFIRKYRLCAEFILNNDLTISTLSIFSTEILYSILSKDIKIPTKLLEEPLLLKKLVELPDTKEYRFIMEALEKSNDISFIEEKRKKSYEEKINKFDKENNMLENYSKAFNYLREKIQNSPFDFRDLDYALGTYIGLDFNSSYYHKLRSDLLDEIRNENIDSLKELLQEESNMHMSNMIIDYHFEEITHNLFLNLKQLLKFQNTNGITLSDDDIKIYTKILNIDDLSYEEKLALHNDLKANNYIEKFYDDLRIAKNKSIELIKESMLTKENIQKHKDQKLTKTTGVNVYTLDKEPFYALVKALTRDKSTPLKNDDIIYTVDASSYSLDSSLKLSTFYSPNDYYTVAYTDFETDQVMHVYPTDSYSRYDRSYDIRPTKRVYELHTPESLSTEYDDYNEMLIAQQNHRRKDELNERLKIPTMFAIYCYDYITENDVKSAKNLGLDIILVKTQNYKDSLNKRNKKSTDTLVGDRLNNGINYLYDFTEDNNINRRK